jgi:hypothetical protein
MKVEDLIKELTKFNPETEIEFVGIIESGFGEYSEMCSEECLIRDEDGFIQLVISGESLDYGMER